MDFTLVLGGEKEVYEIILKPTLNLYLNLPRKHSKGKHSNAGKG